MSRMLDFLRKVSEGDTRVRAVLRRSIAFDPGTFPAAFPYVEPFLAEDAGIWKRTVSYLVAALWAMHGDTPTGTGNSLPLACASLYAAKDKSPSIERRFIALLDADETQLPYRLRQMVALLGEYSIDFVSLLNDLAYWNHNEKPVQVRWARAFYRADTILKNEENETSIKEIGI